MTEKVKNAADGIIGTVIPAGSIAVSLSTVETWMRIASLAIGIAVGAITLARLLRRRS